MIAKRGTFSSYCRGFLKYVDRGVLFSCACIPDRRSDFYFASLLKIAIVFPVPPSRRVRMVWAGSVLACGSRAALERDLGKSASEGCVPILRAGGGLR